MQYSVAQLSGEDWQILKAIRLEALHCEPQSFGSNYEKESRYEESQWRKFIGEHNDRAIFVLKFEDEIIGMTGVISSIDKPDEAILIASYIRSQHRGVGLSQLLYKARINWAKAQNIASLIVSHRENNIASKIANQKFGFQYTHQQSRTWADGVTEMEVFYRLSLC